MRVAKWGISLAVRLRAAVVEALELKEGSEIEIHVAAAREFGVSRKAGRKNCCGSCELSTTAARRLRVRPQRGECPVISRYEHVVLRRVR